MKRYLFVLILFITILTACSKSDNRQPYVQTENDYYTYKINENIVSFDVDEKGTLYYLTFAEAAADESGFELDGKIYSSDKELIKTLDSQGVLLNTYTINGMPNRITLSGNKIFYSVLMENSVSFYEYSIENQTSVKIIDFNDYSAMSELEIIDNKLYFIGINEKNTSKEYSLADYDDQFTYHGETFGCLDLNTRAITELPIELPITFSKTYDDNLVIYAYDEKSGYYFTEYNTKKCEFSDKTFHKVDLYDKFAIYNDKNDFVFQKMNKTFSLASASIAPDEGEIDLIPNFKGGAEILCLGDYTYITNIDTTQISRIKNSTYIRGNDKITMISTELCDFYQPFGCGYTIDQKIITDEEMALSLLSQDKNFDISIMSSRQKISKNIRDKGSFYPLNEVEGVNEYLDACFPYIKDAATNSDGDIWMLPIMVDIPAILYNEKVCSTNGINFAEAMNLDDFSTIIKKCNQNDKLRNKYYYGYSTLINDFFHQYLRSYKDFNNSVFKNLSTFLKQDIGYSDSGSAGNAGLLSQLSVKRNDDIGYITFDVAEYQLEVSNMSNIKACALPHITDDTTNIATCVYLCVNPESKNLEETLQYISSLCGYLKVLKDIIIFKDRNIYPEGSLMDDLYNIYSNGDVQFTLPDELYMDDFKSYLKDEKDLQEMIKDSNRRLDTYMNE